MSISIAPPARLAVHHAGKTEALLTTRTATQCITFRVRDLESKCKGYAWALLCRA